MLRIKIGVQLAGLRQPFKKALLTASRLGAEAVEIDARNDLRPGEFSGTALRQVRKMLADLNLRVAAVGFPTQRGYNVSADLDRRVEATKAAMKFARELGADSVINQVGHIPAPDSGAEWDLLLQVLADLGRYGQHVGAGLAATTGAEDGAVLKTLIDHLPTGALGVDFNPGNLIMNGFSPAEAILELAEFVRQVHMTDATRDLAHGRGMETPLGRGSVDYPALLGALEEHGYHGWFTLVRRPADNSLAELSMAVEYLKNI